MKVKIHLKTQLHGWYLYSVFIIQWNLCLADIQNSGHLQVTDKN